MGPTANCARGYQPVSLYCLLIGQNQTKSNQKKKPTTVIQFNSNHFHTFYFFLSFFFSILFQSPFILLFRIGTVVLCGADVPARWTAEKKFQTNKQKHGINNSERVSVCKISIWRESLRWKTQCNNGSNGVWFVFHLIFDTYCVESVNGCRCFVLSFLFQTPTDSQSDSDTLCGSCVT